MSQYYSLNGHTVTGTLKALLPGLDSWVQPPCGCPGPAKVGNVIVHLNDGCVRLSVAAHLQYLKGFDVRMLRTVWTREEIADWLETLDVDLTFPMPEEAPCPARPLYRYAFPPPSQWGSIPPSMT
jgi:hypothetical protein